MLRTCLLCHPFPLTPTPYFQRSDFLFGLSSLAEPYTCLAAGSEKVRSTHKLKDMPCCEHMAQWARRIKHWVPLSPLLLLLHLGLSVRDTVCQPVHAWPACHVPAPTQNTLIFTETWENPPCSDRGNMQGNTVLANRVKC